MVNHNAKAEGLTKEGVSPVVGIVRLIIVI